MDLRATLISWESSHTVDFLLPPWLNNNSGSVYRPETDYGAMYFRFFLWLGNLNTCVFHISIISTLFFNRQKGMLFQRARYILGDFSR